MMPFNDFRQQATAIPYQYRHSEFLYALVRWLRPVSVVEIGTHIGATAVWLARALQENGVGHLVCIDNFCWRDQPNQETDWHANVQRCSVWDVITLRKGRSQEVQWEPVDLAYIDGNHSFAVCRHDVDKAQALGATCICLNDTATCAGVQQVADIMREGWSPFNEWDFLEVAFDAGLLVAVKRQPRPAPIQDDHDPWDK